MDTLFTHATVVTMDESMHIYPDAYVGVTDGKLSWLSPKAPDAEERPAQIIDATGMVMMPGLINCHTHLPMTILRGYADDYALKEWLEEKIWPREEHLDGRAVKAATLLALAECIRFGTTSVSDMYNFCDEICEAIAESGMKANVSRALMCFDPESFDFEKDERCREAVALYEKWNGYDNGRIKVDTSIHAEYTSCHELWDAAAEYTINQNMSMHAHISETKSEHDNCVERTGLTPAALLDCHHVWDNGGIAAHCVWITEDDMKLLAKRKVSAVHCPVSNAKLASGVADVMSMVKNGMNVALGTDGTSSNNNFDLFEEIKAASLCAKVRNSDPTALNAQAALLMATVCGARAQKREAECGMLKLGMDADLILLNFSQPHLIPCHNVLSHLVYSANGHDVCLTMVRGKILYMDGQYMTIDMNAVVKELAEYTMPHVFAEDKE